MWGDLGGSDGVRIVYEVKQGRREQADKGSRAPDLGNEKIRNPTLEGLGVEFITVPKPR